MSGRPSAPCFVAQKMTGQIWPAGSGHPFEMMLRTGSLIDLDLGDRESHPANFVK